MARGKKNSQTVTGTKVDINNIADDDSVTIVNVSKAGKKTMTFEGMIEFDSEGNAKVSGKLAKSLLTIPGFSTGSGTTTTEETTETTEETSVEE